jgi:TonB family protein
LSSAQTEVRSALAAYVEGSTPLQVFEQSVARLLAGRNSARSEVHEELEAAVADGTLPRESLRRLGLVDASPANAAEIPNSDEKQPDMRPRGRNAPRNREAARDQRASRSPTSAKRTPQIPQCGALLGSRYRLDRVLGEGGMGVVFLATDQEVRGEQFAIKVLRPEIRDNPESLRLLREEVRRTRALRHPHIVGVYSLNTDPSGVYMLMEYLEGRSLKSLLDEDFGRGMPLMRAWPLIYDVGAALAYAHDHNVVHSDIKPSNIIITSSGFCKLLDFGIARADRHRTTIADPTAIGALTPAYACCEMFEGRAPDQSDDVYAFACVIYEMLTGKHPYGRTNAVDARAKKLQPAAIKELTKRQNLALVQALEFDRGRRTTSVEMLLEGLKGKVNNRRDRTAWITSAAAFAAVAVVSTGWFLEHRAHRVPPGEMVQIPARAPEPSPAAVSTEPKPEPAHGKPPVPLVATAASANKAPAAPGAPPAITANKTPAAPLTLPAVPATINATVPAPVIPSPPVIASPVEATPAGAQAAPKVGELASAESTPLPMNTAPKGEIDRPPFGKHLPAVIATSDAQARMQSEENCPYPAEARNEMQTGTVVLLVYVSPDGSAANVQLDRDGSSGSGVLNLAAIKCVREMGHFPPKIVDSKPVGYWARTKFVWSFGG